MSNLAKKYMSKMGTGETSSDDLTYDQAFEVMQGLLNEEFDPVSFGGFMVAERWKSQTPNELAGFLDAIRTVDFQSIQTSRSDVLDVAGRFDGKERSVNTDFAGSIIASAAGVNIFTHSGQNIPTQEAVTVLDIIDSLGWQTRPSLSLSGDCLDELGFSYSHQQVYAPRLDDLRSYRRELGVRSFLNTVESMVNPTDSDWHLGAFYHLPFAARVCETFARSETQDLDRVFMIQGIEGQTEFRPGSSLFVEWSDGELSDREVKTSKLGLNYDRDQLEEIGSDPGRSAELMLELFQTRETPQAYRESTLLNAAVKIYASNIESTLKEATDRAREVLESKEALDFYTKLSEVFTDDDGK